MFIAGLRASDEPLQRGKGKKTKPARAGKDLQVIKIE
jgi:hypothetical protein